MARNNSTQLRVKDDRKQLGIGLGAAGLGNADAVKAIFSQAAQCAIYALPTVAKVQWEFAGPITNAQTKKTLGATINILGSGSNPDGVDEVYSTPGLINGEFQTFVMACAVGVHLEVSPYCFTAPGNAFARPAGGVTATKPFSPDAWTTNDATNAWGGSTAPSMRAQLVYGEPALEAYWAMVRAYNLRWTYGSLINILDEQLRETAYMPPNAQDGSASSSELDVLRCAREVNTRYASVLGSTLDFAMIDTVRIGSLGAAPGNVGQFAPNNDLQRVAVTYGGSDLRAKIGVGNNSEFRSLTNPYILKSGVPIGLVFEEQNQELGDYFRSQFDVTQGVTGGLSPAQFTESSDFATGATSAFQERTIDGLSVNQTVVAQSALFKGFRALMSNEIKGWEITESLAAMIRDNSNLAAWLCSECGVQIGWAN